MISFRIFIVIDVLPQSRILFIFRHAIVINSMPTFMNNYDETNAFQ